MTKRRIIVIDGIGKTAKEWCAEYNVPYNTYKSRTHKGATPKEALMAATMTKQQSARLGKKKGAWMENFELPGSAPYRREKTA